MQELPLNFKKKQIQTITDSYKKTKHYIPLFCLGKVGNWRVDIGDIPLKNFMWDIFVRYETQGMGAPWNMTNIIASTGQHL